LSEQELCKPRRPPFTARLIAALALVGCVSLSQAAWATPKAQPAEIVVEPATQTAIALRWPVIGDENSNARISVAYRPEGEDVWQVAHDLFRTHPDHVSPDNRVVGGWLFAGSIVGLEAGTGYEVRLTLEDADGGSTVRTVMLQTRSEPALPSTLRQRFVRPLQTGEAAGGEGTRDDPLRGLAMAAMAAEPGDLLLLQPGVYAEQAIRLRSGLSDRPIAIEGSGAVILDGEGADRLLDLRGLSHLWVKGLTFRNATVLVDAAQASDIILQGNRFQVVKFGVRAHGATYTQSRHIVVSDNSFEGWLDWPPSRPYPEIYAVSLTGSGHVVRFNRIRRVRDGIYNGDDGRLSASDFHNNDIAQCGDDGIETDYADTNVRVFENRIVDCLFGVSAQPAHGGPVYIYRNFIYNARSSPFKLHNHTSGVLIYHNTSVRQGIPFLIQPGNETVNDVVTRNNLFIGTSGPALRSTGRMRRCDFDNDGFSWSSGPFALWNGHTISRIADALGGDGPYSVLGAIDMGLKNAFSNPLWPPSDPNQQTDLGPLDPRIAGEGRAVDQGAVLRGFNDGFAGRAPDLGCCELGAPLPHYGPR
jgi:nitrous oxidase accessory protein NosD